VCVCERVCVCVCVFVCACHLICVASNNVRSTEMAPYEMVPVQKGKKRVLGHACCHSLYVLNHRGGALRAGAGRCRRRQQEGVLKRG
jgi:hypothetical protein